MSVFEKEKVIFYSQQGEDLLVYRNFINLPTKDGIFLELGSCIIIIYNNK